MTTSHLHPVQQERCAIAVVHRPDSLVEALQLLSEAPGRRPLAGGTDILLDLQRGGPGPAVELVDLTAVEGFASIAETDTHLQLGGGVTHNQLISHPGAHRSVTPLAQACLEIGSPQLRNRATIAGNLATASPANDSLSALLALGGEVELSRWHGSGVVSRSVELDRFFTGFRETVLEPDELITGIVVPKLRDEQRGLWVKLGNRRAQAISVIHAAFVLSGDGSAVTGARMAFGSVAATVSLAADAAAQLIGSTLDEETIQRCAGSVAAQFSPINDVRATAQYRKQTLETVVVRALEALRDDRQLEAWPLRPPNLAAGPGHVAGPSGRLDDEQSITVSLNGAATTAPGAASVSLLDWLRERGAVGTKEGCAEGECGACTVQLNGAAVMSCIVNAAQADGGTVVTVEGLPTDGKLHPIQQAFIDEFAVQCGYCIPGFLVAGASLLDEVDQPTEDQIRLGFSGNLCRCTGYYPMITAVQIAAAGRSEGVS